MRRYQAVCDDCGPIESTRATRQEASRDRDRHRCPATTVDTITGDDIMGIARGVALRYVRSRPGSAPYLDDLISDAALAGVAGLLTFKTDGGASIQTYLWTRMRGGMIDAIRERGHFTRHQVRNGEHERTDLPARMLPPMALEPLREIGVDVADPLANAPILRFEDHDLAHWLLDNTDLTDQERDVLARNVMGTEGLFSIAVSYGFTESRACQIKNNALRKLRATLARAEEHERTPVAA